eukprot:2595375-Rhodomonas_salina.1
MRSCHSHLLLAEVKSQPTVGRPGVRVAAMLVTITATDYLGHSLRLSSESVVDTDPGSTWPGSITLGVGRAGGGS